MVPARDICSSFKDSRERPAGDCAYIEVVGYFAAIDEIVARAQRVEGFQSEHPGKPLPDDLLEEAEQAFDEFSSQINGIQTAADQRILTYKVDKDFKRYLEIQLLRTYCSARPMFLTFSGNFTTSDCEHSPTGHSKNFCAMRDYVIAKNDDTLEGFCHDSGGPDCSRARTL